MDNAGATLGVTYYTVNTYNLQYLLGEGDFDQFGHQPFRQ